MDFQWIWRRESPGAYSRIAWNDMSASTRRRVGWPSRSRTSPALVEGTTAVPRVDVEFAHVRQLVLSTQQSERVAADRGGRADVMMPRRSVGMTMVCANPVARAKERHPEFDEAVTDRQVEPPGQADAASHVADDDLAGHLVPATTLRLRQQEVMSY